MRKRKSPIVLVTLLVVVVAGITGFNYATSKPGGNPADQPPAPPVSDVKPVGAARPPQKTTDVANALKGTMGNSSTKPAAMGGPEGGPPGPPGAGGPLILNPARAAALKPEKPKPNSSSTSSQWYNSESSLAGQKG